MHKKQRELNKEHSRQGRQGVANLTAEVRSAIDGSGKRLEKTIRKELASLREFMNTSMAAGRLRRTISEFSTPVLSAAALLAAVFSIFLAIDSSSRDNLTSTFDPMLAACVRMNGVQAEAHATLQKTVITNAGRLPITIISVWDGDEEGDSFSWVRIDDTSSRGTDEAVRLDVGDAIAVQVLSSGNTSQVPLNVLTSDGRERSLNQVKVPAAASAVVVGAYAKLPECKPAD